MAATPHQSNAERREQISRALLAVMAEHGYARASITKIAQQAGITPGLIHYHFPNKQAILLEVVERIVTQQLTRLERALDAQRHPAERLDALIDAFLATGDTADPAALAAWVSISAEAIRQPEVRDALHSALQRFLTPIQDILSAGMMDGTFGIAPLTPDACAAAILATVQGYFTLAATAPDMIPPASAAPCARRMIYGLLHVEVPHDIPEA